MVAAYRIYFRGGTGAIVGREDFSAEDHDRALLIAEALCDACSDVCMGYELWQGTRLIDAGVETGPRRLSWRKLAPDIQQSVVDLEERLRDSSWAVAESRRLLEQTSRLVDAVAKRR